MKRLKWLSTAIWLLTLPVQGNDAMKAIEGYSSIRGVAPERLAKGEIEGRRIPAAGGELSISTETLFAVPLPPERVVKLMKDTVSATQVQASTTLDVELHLPVSVPARPEDFERLNLQADPSARWLMAASARGVGAGLNLNAVEADQLQRADSSEKLEQAWRKLLAHRARIFQERGWTGVPPYDLGNRSFNPCHEMVRLLKTTPLILEQFKDLLGVVMTAQHVSPAESTIHYWESSKIQGERTITLAAVAARRVAPDVWQVVEPCHYVSSKYFSSLILYEVRNFPMESGQGSLVWRGDFIITPSIGLAKGIERMAAENITLLEVRKSVRAFAEECRMAAAR